MSNKESDKITNIITVIINDILIHALAKSNGINNI